MKYFFDKTGDSLVIYDENGAYLDALLTNGSTESDVRVVAFVTEYQIKFGCNVFFVNPGIEQWYNWILNSYIDTRRNHEQQSFTATYITQCDTSKFTLLSAKAFLKTKFSVN